MNTQKESGVAKAFWRPILWGVIIGVLLCALLLFLMALGLTAWDVPQATVSPLAMVAVAVGAFVGGFTAARIKKQQGWLLGAAVGALLYGVIWLTEIGQFGEMQAMTIFIKWAISIACGAVGGILGVNFRRRPHH